jgi:hypothetical protein
VASTTTGILTARVTPEIARRSWPGWLALGVLMVAAGVTGVLWSAAGPRLLLAVVGLLLAARSAQALRPAAPAGAGLLPAAVAVAAGLAAVVVAALSASLAGRVLTVGVPALLAGTAVVLLVRGGTGRRGGAALLVWSLLVTGALVAAGVAQGWSRAEDVATVVAGLAVAAMGVPVLLGAVNLRAVAATPAPARPAACSGCACGAGGCGGALG